MFIALLSFGRSLTTKFKSRDNQPCLAKPTLIDLNHDELRYYPFMVSLDRRDGRCNTLHDPSLIIFNLSIFNFLVWKFCGKTQFPQRCA